MGLDVCSMARVAVGAVAGGWSGGVVWVIVGWFAVGWFVVGWFVVGWAEAASGMAIPPMRVPARALVRALAVATAAERENMLGNEPDSKALTMKTIAEKRLRKQLA